MKKPITIISSVSIILFVIAIIAFATGIYGDKKTGTIKADERYEKLLRETKQNFAANPYGTSDFSNAFIRAIGNIDDFSSLKLEVNGTMVYSYPPSSFSLPSPELIKTYSNTINVNDYSFTLRASLYLMTPGSVYKHSRLAFLLILIGTILSGVFIVFTSGTDNEPKSEVKAKEPVKAAVKATAEEINISFDTKLSSKPEGRKSVFNPDEILENAESIQSSNQESSKEENSEEAAEATVSTKTGESLSRQESVNEAETKLSEESNKNTEPDSFDIIDQLEQENEALSDENYFAKEDSSRGKEDTVNSQELSDPEEAEPVFTPIEEPVTPLAEAETFEPEPAEAETELEEEAVKEDLTEPSLSNYLPEEKASVEVRQTISPVTNLNLQAVLEESLDKAIEADKNITLSLVKINGLDRGNSISQGIISILKQKSLSSDLFEYRADGYAVILYNTDLQDAVDRFEDIYNKLTDFLKDNNAVNEVSVGISSVCSRTIKAERIILEASQALDYASQDPDSPIVAFRANPEKYQEYIESNS